MISLGFSVVVFAITVSTPNPDVQKDGGNQSPPTNYQSVASPNPTSIAQASSNEGQNKKHNPRARKNRFLAWCKRNEIVITLASAVAVAIFTGVLTLYTVKLWKSGEKHSERELRAYVGVISADLQKHVDTGLIKAEIKVANRGQTPAYDLTIVSTFDFHEIPRTEFSTYGKNTIPQSRSMVLPNDDVPMAVCAERALTSDDFKAVREERFAFFFYGKIRYKDAFGKDRFTDFRYVAGNDKTGTLTWQVTEEGNDAN